MKSLKVYGKNMKIKLLFAILSLTCSIFANEKNLATEEIEVYRNGSDVFVRSYFNEKDDFVLYLYETKDKNNMYNELLYIIPKTANIKEAKKYTLLKLGGDDNVAYAFNKYGFLGGNHGSSFGRKITKKNHGLSNEDLGKSFTAEDLGKFILLSIIDENTFLIHPENLGKDGFPIFKSLSKQKLFFNNKEFKYTNASAMQVYPNNRITKNLFLVDGEKPLEDKTIVKCKFLDHIVDYDILMPESIVMLAQENIGEKINFLDEKVKSLMTINSINRYENLACVVYLKIITKHNISGYNAMGVQSGWYGRIANYKNQEFYIPKVKPMTVKGFRGAPDLNCDFANIYKMPKKMNVNSYMRAKDCIDPYNIPDRFIRLVGNDKREYGVALGYSLINGETKLINKGKNRYNFYHLWHTKKFYPYCLNINNPKENDIKEVIAYRQYFNPNMQNEATNFYYHKEYDDYIVYLDFHKNVDKLKINLPKFLEGKQATVIEKTDSVTLDDSNNLIVSVKDNYGYIVLKLKAN